MANITSQAIMDAYDPDQSMDAISQTAREVPYNVAGQRRNQQIDRLTAFDQYIVRFGQTEPCTLGEQRFVHNRHRTKVFKCFAIVVLLLAVILSSIRHVPNTPPLNIEDTLGDNHQKLVMKEEDKCDCPNPLIEDKLGANTNDETTGLTIYDEPNVEDMFTEISTTEHVDNSACALYDMFLSVFTKLCTVKDDIIAILPSEPQDDNYSTDNGNEKAGQTLATTDDLSLPKTKQNGAVSSDDTHLPNIHISKETDPMNSSEQFHDKDAT